jgi:hypothetical protein
MSETRSFADVTPAVWERVKDVGRRDYGTEFSPADGDVGTARTMTPVGLLELDYELDRSRNAITYRIRRKPMLLISAPLWRGLEDTINRCRAEVSGV